MATTTTYEQQPGVVQPGVVQQPGFGQPVFGQPVGQTVVVAQPTVGLGGGGCIYCGGMMRDSFTPLGIVFAVVFFPLGILCCFLMTEKRCSSCGR